jgi:ribosomal peptide maturation radical SAM protein 1
MRLPLLEGRDVADVLLVCMPFGSVFRPSIGLSLLKAGLARSGLTARVRYFSIDFAVRVGQGFYYGISDDDRPPTEDLAGEWIFASGLFRPTRRSVAAYVKQVLRKLGDPDKADEAGASDALIARILDARRQVAPFLDDCAEEVLRERPRVVGFTSAFQQHTASLALARRIKQQRPAIAVVFGGANCTGRMGAETVRQFPFVDAVVSGEGDIVFPKLVGRILGSRPLGSLPGVLTSSTGARRLSGEPPCAPIVTDLDELAEPDYSDYFEQFNESRLGREWQPSVPFETARGCWWGQKTQCTFCGLNGTTLSYRSKSPRRALEELVRLIEGHPECDVDVTDSILDPRYFRRFLPELGHRRLGATLCWEMKANLTKDQLRILRDAGVRLVQPGIESLSDAVLELMRKGVTGLQNIQVLKWCRELGIRPYWNLLWGFPDEPPEEYARMARLVPLLTHLTPPAGFGPIRLDRFSPLFRDAAHFGLTKVNPLASYRHIYPFPDSVLKNLAHSFRFRYRSPRDVPGYVRPLERALEVWTAKGNRSDLFSAAVDGRLLLWDFRPCAREPLTVLDGLDKTLYEACDAVSHLRQLARAAGCRRPDSRALDEVEGRLVALVDRGLLIKDGPRYLALASPIGEQVPKPGVAEAFREIVRQLGKRAYGGVRVPVTGASGRRFRWPPRARRGRGRSSRRHIPASSAFHFSFCSTDELFVRFGP